jgi:hypothetical protein
MQASPFAPPAATDISPKTKKWLSNIPQNKTSLGDTTTITVKLDQENTEVFASCVLSADMAFPRHAVHHDCVRLLPDYPARKVHDICYMGLVI